MIFPKKCLGCPPFLGYSYWPKVVGALLLLSAPLALLSFRRFWCQRLFFKVSYKDTCRKRAPPSYQWSPLTIDLLLHHCVRGCPVRCFLVTVIHQLSFVQSIALQKCILLPFLPCETAKFSRLGAGSPPNPLKFHRCFEVGCDLF